jgi:hypothetical protein
MIIERNGIEYQSVSVTTTLCIGCDFFESRPTFDRSPCPHNETPSIPCFQRDHELRLIPGTLIHWKRRSSDELED